MIPKLFFIHCCFFLLPFSLSALNVSVGATAADYLTDGTNDEVEIQSAINAVNAAGGGTVTLKDGTYNIQTTYILPKSNVTLTGTSRDGTVLSSTRTYNFLIWTNNIAVYNFSIKQLTINALNSDHASGVLLEKATRCAVSNVKFIGVTCSGWDLVVGIDGTAAGTDNVFSRDIVIENCLFDGHKGSLEMLLLYNTKNCRVENCTFLNKTKGCTNDGNSPVLGLWQKTDSVSILNCTFLNNQSREAIYHSNTCDNTLIENSTFMNTGGIHGTNESDWGTFGVPYERRLAIRNCTMTAGANDLTETAIKLGAIEGVLIKDCNITGYEEGMVIQAGLAASLPAGAKHFAVVRTNIRNGNPANNVHALHAGILFQNVAGKMHGFFICGDISSALSPPKQEQAVAFYNYPDVITFDSLFWLGTNITSYNTRPDFRFLNGATQGTPFVVEKCNGASPPSYCADCLTMSDAAIEAKIRTYDAVSANIIRDLLAYQAKNIVLPIELLNFGGTAEKTGNRLTWQLADAKDLTGLTLEKSENGVNFIPLSKKGQITALSTFDMSPTVDESPFELTYYRLKMIELDGKKRFSKIISVKRAEILRGIKMYPNPVNNVLNIENVEGQTIEIFNVLGQVVVKLMVNYASFSVNVSQLRSGLYFLKTGGEVVRFVKN